MCVSSAIESLMVILRGATVMNANKPDASVEAPTSQCLGDPGECAYNKACMYQCQGGQVPVETPTEPSARAILALNPEAAQQAVPKEQQE